MEGETIKAGRSELVPLHLGKLRRRIADCVPKANAGELVSLGKFLGLPYSNLLKKEIEGKKAVVTYFLGGQIVCGKCVRPKEAEFLKEMGERGNLRDIYIELEGLFCSRCKQEIF